MNKCIAVFRVTILAQDQKEVHFDFANCKRGKLVVSHHDVGFKLAPHATNGYYPPRLDDYRPGEGLGRDAEGGV